MLALMLLKPDSGLPKGLVRSSFDCEPLIARMRTELLDPTSFQIPKGSNGAPVCMTTAGNTVASGAATMDELATRLTRPGQPKVVNKTSLEGRYEFRLQYSPSIPANATGDEPPPLATASICERRPRLDSVPIERYARNGAHPRAFLCRSGVAFRGKEGPSSAEF